MLPCQRKTRSQGKMGRAHKSYRAPQWVHCPNCGSAKQPHAACGECGYGPLAGQGGVVGEEHFDTQRLAVDSVYELIGGARVVRVGHDDAAGVEPA